MQRLLLNLYAQNPPVRLTEKVAYASLSQAVTAGDLYGALDLIEEGAAVDALDESEETPLLQAAEEGHPYILDELLHAGADLFARDGLGNTAMHLAAAAEQVYTLDMLKTKGLGLEERNQKNYTPLHLAAELGKVESVKALAQLGADLNANAHPEVASNAVTVAGKAKQFSVIQTLMEFGVQYTASQAVFYGDLEGLKAMVDKDRNVLQQPDLLGYTLLHKAVINKERPIIEYLLEQGLSLDSETREGMTPFMSVVEGQDPELLDLCLAHGADLEAEVNGRFKEPMLHYAIRRGRSIIIPHLIERGAKLDTQNAKGLAALHVAWKRISRILCNYCCREELTLTKRINRHAPLYIWRHSREARNW